MKSIISGNLVEVKTKQRQRSVLKTSPTDSLAYRSNLSPQTSSQKHPVPQITGSEVKQIEAFSSGQVLDLSITPTTDPIPILKEQRRDIDRIMATVSILQQDMVSLEKSVERLEGRRNQESNDFIGDVTDDTINVGSRSSELGAVKLDMKILQQRIKRMEESRSKVLGSSQVSRLPSPTTNQRKISLHDSPSNGSLLPSTQMLMFRDSDSLFAGAQPMVYERHNVVDGGNTTSQGFPSGPKAEALPVQKSSTTKLRQCLSGTASRGSRAPVNMPPPQIPRKGPEQKVVGRRSSTGSNVATPRTASTSITSTPNSATFPRITSQMQQASTGSHQNYQDGHQYDDELVDDVRPQLRTGSSTGSSRRPASKTAPLRRSRPDEPPQQTPSKPQRRQSVPLPSLTPEPSNENELARGRKPHHDSKRRKTSASDTNMTCASIGPADSRESRPSSGRGRSARLRNLEIKLRKRPGREE